jgi:hypothetical protein
VSIRRTLRSTIKWGGAAVTVLLLIVWVGSAWYGAHAHLNTVGASVWSGRLYLVYESTSFPVTLSPGVGIGRASVRFEWWFYFSQRSYANGEVNFIVIPLWFPALLLVIGTLLLWRADRKCDPNACAKCGYSRTGLPADRLCPECGAVTPRPSHS